MTKRRTAERAVQRRAKPAPARVHWLQHAEHEGLGCIGPWLARRGYRVTRTRLQRGEPLPAPAAVDWLIVMGGPMNIYEHERYPWLAAEKAFINDVLVINKKTLGVCLGGQLLADVMGARVTANEHQEIGWLDVSLTEKGEKSPLFDGFPKVFSAFHWHGDTFGMPVGVANLMKSDACVNQAFATDRCVGLQFHLEVRLADARRWLALQPPAPARYVQSAAEMLRDPARFALNNRLMARLLEHMASL